MSLIKKNIGYEIFLKGIILLVVIHFNSCQKKRDSNTERIIHERGNEYLFSIKKPEETGIHFKNSLNENRNLNGILYEYLYNGGGVAIADFNDDGMQDIYFVSNLESNKLYLNKGELKFHDITDISKVGGKNGFPTGVTTVDINYDGKQDIYICKSGKYSNPDDRRNELYVNTGNNEQGVPVFEEMAKKYGLDLPNYSTQSAFLDYDKDGDLDMFLLNHGLQPYPDEAIYDLIKEPSPLQSSRLFRNDDGFYKDVSAESGVVDNAISFGLGIAIGDLNNDNWPDVLIGHDFSEKDQLYLNQQDGTFREVIKEATNHISYFSMGNDIADFNNDGWLDFISLDMMSEHNYDIKTSMSGMNPKRFHELTGLGLHYQYMYNTLQINNGIMNQKSQVPVFSDVAQITGTSSTDWSWGPLFFDMDNDGWKDLFVSNGIKRDFRNNDFIRYKKKKFDEFFEKYPENSQENKQLARNLTMELVNEMPKRSKPNYFFRNSEGTNFLKKNNEWVEDITTSSNGAAYADLDNDGDLDIVVNNTDDFAFIYENNSDKLNNSKYLHVKLKGPEKNPDALGARVILQNDDKKQIIENYHVRGFQSSSNDILFFGVGDAQKVDKLKIIWPDNKTSTLQDVTTNQALVVNYNTAIVEHNEEKSGNKLRLFEDITNRSGLGFRHIENDFDDFEREVLLPHQMSKLGPAIAKSDLNKDGLDDFYVGGAHGQGGKLYIQTSMGDFTERSTEVFLKDKNYEDVDALFFDIDGDHDDDLYIVSGGNEFDEGSEMLENRLYENLGNFVFKRVENLALPKVSGSKVKAADFDSDGDLDLFVGGRQKPGSYPEPVSSFLLQNESNSASIKFLNVTDTKAPSLLNLGMVTDAIWIDADNDQWVDLMIVGEWMSPVILRNNKGVFENITGNSGLQSETGWWFSLAPGDFDSDGDLDVIAGSIGLNYKYKASKNAPFEIYSNDFDGNGKRDIVLGYYDLGKLYPLRGRECSSAQIPNIKDKFKNYHSFGQATLPEIYGEGNLSNSLHYKATNFATCYFENKGDGTFKVKKLGDMTQISSVNSIAVEDFDADGFDDILIAGNWYVSEVETPRNDASYGMFLKGNGKGKFKEVLPYDTGLYIRGDVRHIQIISSNQNSKKLIIAKNNDSIQIYRINDLNPNMNLNVVTK